MDAIDPEAASEPVNRRRTITALRQENAVLKFRYHTCTSPDDRARTRAEFNANEITIRRLLSLLSADGFPIDDLIDREGDPSPSDALDASTAAAAAALRKEATGGKPSNQSAKIVEFLRGKSEATYLEIATALEVDFNPRSARETKSSNDKYKKAIRRTEERLSDIGSPIRLAARADKVLRLLRDE